MSLKMDRIGARTPSDLERKYGKYGKIVYENEKNVNQKVQQSTFDEFAEAVSKELGNKVGADEVAEALNNCADLLNLESDLMKIKGSGFELAGGEAKITKGLVGGWVVEHDMTLGEIMRSPTSVYGRLVFKVNNVTSQLVGNVFTVLAPMGLVYVVKEFPDYSSATKGSKYFYEATFELTT